MRLAQVLSLLLALVAPTVSVVSAHAQAGTATPVVAGGPVEFVWATTGGDVPFSYPMDVTVDPQGNVWVVDMGNSQFQIFSPDGQFLEAWGTKGDGPGEFNFFEGPVALETDFGGDVAFDREGNIYVADLANHRVQKFASDRTFLRQWGTLGAGDGQFMRPWSLDVDAAGNVYVADYGRSNVQVFDSDGTYLRTLASHGSKEDQLSDAASVVVAPDGTVWVSDYRGTILSFAPDGTFRGAYGSFGAEEGQFNTPNVGDAWDGYVYVADVENHRIQVFDMEGRFVTAWGSEGSDPGQLSYPVGVTLDGHGNAYVIDMGNSRLQKFRLLTPLAAAATPMAAATPVAAAAPVAFVWQTGGGPQLALDDPFQLAVDPQGKLWVADGQNSRFQVFDADGAFLETWGTPGNGEGELDFTFSNYDPTGAAAFDASGALYVLDPGNLRVQKFDAERHFVAAWGSLGTGDGEFLHPYDIAVDAAGRVYVIDDGRDDVQVFAGDGRFLHTIAHHGTGEGELNNTGGLAVAPDGAVWVADFGNNRVQAFAPDGAFLRMVGGPGVSEGQFYSPIDVAVDRQGRVYVVDMENYRVQIFAADGDSLARFGGYGIDENEFALPAGVALDGAGHVYVSDAGLDRVRAFRLLAPLTSATPVA